MIHVAVCDDDLVFASLVESLIIDWDPRYEFDVEVFSDGTTLLQAISQGYQYDLIFLDIEMKDLDGYQTAKKLRAIDEDIMLVFISIHTNYMQRLFEVSPIAFISKPLYPDKLIDCLRMAVERLDRRKLYFTYTKNRQEYKVKLMDIMYFESNNRKTQIYTRHTSDSFYRTLSLIEKDIQEASIPFLRIHQSYLVNCHFVSQYKSASLLLENGISLPISVERRKSCKEKYHSLMRRSLYGKKDG